MLKLRTFTLMRCIYLVTKLSVIILNEDKDFLSPLKIPESKNFNDYFSGSRKGTFK